MCDNTACDYKAEVKQTELEGWINKPCPKCGENLLTPEDYINGVSVQMSAALLNAMSEEDLMQFADILKGEKKVSTNEKTLLQIDTHNGITITQIKE